MNHEVRITARALADADAVIARLAPHSPQSAARWHAALLEKMQTLEQSPERCPLAAEAAILRIDLRELLFGKKRNVYRILFTIHGEVVVVHQIRHAGRDRIQPGDVEL